MLCTYNLWNKYYFALLNQLYVKVTFDQYNNKKKEQKVHTAFTILPVCIFFSLHDPSIVSMMNKLEIYHNFNIFPDLWLTILPQFYTKYDYWITTYLQKQ